MFSKRMICLLAVAACLAGFCISAAAVEVESDTTYCFSAGDFGEETLKGICITGLPDSAAGTVMLGHRVLQPGDILTAQQLTQMTFSPLRTDADQEATVTYLPIYPNRVEKAAIMTISIRGKEDKAPVAEDMFLETYKNLPNEGALKVFDPEGQALQYTVTRQPKRGQVEVSQEGMFTYTPKKNKVGVDSFVYTATDPAGNVSREATVTVRILKPSDAAQYTDTIGASCRFAAEWMKNTGLFIGEQVGGQLCFGENMPVSKGQFVAMAVELLGIPVDENAEFTGYADDMPAWLKPYLAAALRSGMTAGIPVSESGAFGVEQAITGAEAAVMLQNTMDLAVDTASLELPEAPEWAAASVAAMNASGVVLSAEETLTRGQVAQILYQVSQMAENAPGLQMYR
jgi:hypothetical protein